MINKLSIKSTFFILILSLFLLVNSSYTIKATENKLVTTKSEIKIKDIFEDPNFAKIVADKLNKDINDVVVQSDLDTVDYLVADNSNITSIKGIERLHEVSALILSHNNINDLTPFSLDDFPNLNMLELTFNDISDISPLKRPTSLTQLMLDYNKIDNIEEALTFNSYINNSSGAPLSNLYASNQKVTMKTKNNPKLSKSISKYGVNGTYSVYNISDNGTFVEENNSVEWDNLDLSVTSTKFSYSLTNFAIGGTWTYSADVTLNIEPAIVNVKYVSDNGVSLADTITLEGAVTKPYETNKKDFEGYTLTKTPSNANGVFKDEDQTVNYVYSKDKDVTTNSKLNIVINHHYNGKKKISENKEIDANKNIDLSKWLKTDNDGINYKFDKLIITPDNKVIIKSKDMNHTFTKNNDNVVDVYYSDYPELPKTGSNSIYNIIIIAMISSIYCLTYSIKKYN